MLCLFTSCFIRGDDAVGNSHGSSHIYNDDLKPRRVNVRESTDKETAAYRRSVAPSADSFGDEKTALKTQALKAEKRDPVDCEEDEEEIVSNVYLSEKHIEAGGELPSLAKSETREETIVEEHRWRRRGVFFKKPKFKAGKGSSGALLQAQHTGDELQRRFEFERSVKKMKGGDFENAWAIERERQKKWDDEHKRAQKNLRG
ncbi:hypothetical protein K432DRAFT_386405 [Lepidopterella palustris CBS 459.81]|uniref:Uncharacterized protein n=1 Tax=Lepidopterella palustris CBS 459.81 TaxID=1314670 RepID=A0A8E2JA78_9PEZI|nr:hypothetical protein K432DRAFT_386405 [Lepidopterella palustris CBS 459.81]